MKVNLWVVSWVANREGEATSDSTVCVGKNYLEVFSSRKEARKCLTALKDFMHLDSCGIHPNKTPKLTKQVLEL